MALEHGSDPGDLGDIMLVARAYGITRGQAKSMLRDYDWDIEKTCDVLDDRIERGLPAFASLEQWTPEQKAAYRAATAQTSPPRKPQ